MAGQALPIPLRKSDYHDRASTPTPPPGADYDFVSPGAQESSTAVAPAIKEEEPSSSAVPLGSMRDTEGKIIHKLPLYNWNSRNFQDQLHS